MLTGTNLVYTKQFNLRIVHETIRLYGPLPRAEIARRTELTPQTVSNLVRELIAYGLVREAERRQEGRGAPSIALAINPDAAYTLGLDLDRDHLTGVLVDLAGKVRQRVSIPLDFPSPREALDLMSDAAHRLVDREGLELGDVSGVGVGIPGPMHPSEDGRGYVVSPKLVPGWEDVPLARWLEDRLGLPVVLENNATAAAVGERWYGTGQEIGTFFYVYFGSGLGGGIVMNGQPYEGRTGNAGEIGYLPTGLAGDEEGGEESSHVGMHFNLPRLYERLRRQGVDAATPADLDRLLREEHPGVLEWLEDAAAHLTGLVLVVEYLLDPEAIFFGGRLPQPLIRALMDRVAAQLPARHIVGKVYSPRYLLARAGADAAALGVATLPIYQLLAPTPRLLMKQGRGQGARALEPAKSIAGS